MIAERNPYAIVVDKEMVEFLAKVIYYQQDAWNGSRSEPFDDTSNLTKAYWRSMAGAACEALVERINRSKS